MFLHEAPYLPVTNHSAQLRAAAVKAQCKVDILGTTSDYASKLRAFWDDQKERVENDNGLPSDGVYLGPGNTDFRPLAYLVVSYLRLSKDTAKVAAFKDFCTAMSVAAGTVVDIPVTSVTVSPANATVVVGETTTLTAAVLPLDATDPSVVWSSADQGTATVVGGVVTGVAGGTVVVTATNTASGLSGSANITVPAPLPDPEQDTEAATEGTGKNGI